MAVVPQQFRRLECFSNPSKSARKGLDLAHVPPTLNVMALEQYLREHGDEICKGRVVTT